MVCETYDGFENGDTAVSGTRTSRLIEGRETAAKRHRRIAGQRRTHTNFPRRFSRCLWRLGRHANSKQPTTSRSFKLTDEVAWRILAARMWGVSFGCPYPSPFEDRSKA